MSTPIADGCSRGLPLRERWTRRGHIVHSSHSVRPTVTDHKEEKRVANILWRPFLREPRDDMVLFGGRGSWVRGPRDPQPEGLQRNRAIRSAPADTPRTPDENCSTPMSTMSLRLPNSLDRRASELHDLED